MIGAWLFGEADSDKADGTGEEGGSTVDDGDNRDECDEGEDDFEFHTLPMCQKNEGAKAAL